MKSATDGPHPNSVEVYSLIEPTLPLSSSPFVLCTGFLFSITPTLRDLRSIPPGRMFSFPPQPESGGRAGNWYQELLDHPECQSDPIKVCEAYETYRLAGFERSATTLTWQDDSSNRKMITPSPALTEYLKHIETCEEHGSVALSKTLDSHYQHDTTNCMVIWARPSAKVIALMMDLQKRLETVVGADMWFPEPARLHLSVLEISHRHTIAQLRSVYDSMGEPLVKRMLDYPAKAAEMASPKKALLGKPMLIFDGVGVALSFVPIEGQCYTYHHLRRDLYDMALLSGVQMDTCYTACTSHLTLGRFVSRKTFESEKGEYLQERAAAWVDVIKSINRGLQKHNWTEEWNWVVGEENGLEMQLGMLKFGRETAAAEMVGRRFAD